MACCLSLPAAAAHPQLLGPHARVVTGVPIPERPGLGGRALPPTVLSFHAPACNWVQGPPGLGGDWPVAFSAATRSRRVRERWPRTCGPVAVSVGRRGSALGAWHFLAQRVQPLRQGGVLLCSLLQALHHAVDSAAVAGRCSHRPWPRQSSVRRRLAGTARSPLGGRRAPPLPARCH